MKLSWTTVLVITLFSSKSLLAADASFCDQYAKTSIKQQLSNITASCKQKGLRWSSLYDDQHAWCLTVRQSIADNETKARNEALDKCGAPLSKAVWKDDKSFPSAGFWRYTEMKAATKKDDLNAVKFMVSQGVVTSDPGGDNDGGLLYLAVDHQAEKVSEYLLDQGKSPQSIPNGGGNALAAMVGDAKINYRMLAMLLKRGFDPNYGGEGYRDEYFPVMMATIKNNYHALKVLLKAGGDPNITRDSTPLNYAIKNRNLSIVKLLIESGAKVNASGTFLDGDQLPLDIALKSGNQEIANYLKSKGAKSKAS